MIDTSGATGTARLEIFRLYLNGQFTEPVNGRFFDKVNPASGEVDALMAMGDIQDISHAVRYARQALSGEWQDLSGTGRSAVLHRFAAIIREDQENLAFAMVKDIGKSIAAAREEVQQAADYWEFHAGMADKIYGMVNPAGSRDFSFTLREPVGVVGVITPMDTPIWSLTIKAAPALACGNTVVVKPSEMTPRGALRLAELAAQAGIPAGVLNVVTGDGEGTGAMLARHEDVDHVTFAGNSEIGKQVAEAAASHLATATCELSGKAAAIAFADADISMVVDCATRMLTDGGAPFSVVGSRLLVAEEIHKKLVKELAPRINTIRVGLPLDERSQLSCIPTVERLERIVGMVRMTREEGAQLIAGGNVPNDPDLQHGYYYRPTVFDGVKPGMQIAREEVMGPVLSIIPFQDEKEAVQIANATRFGLGAWLFTRDIDRVHRMVRALDVGVVHVNSAQPMHPAVSYAGFKESGLGYEAGMEAVNVFTRLKTVSVGLQSKSSK